MKIKYSLNERNMIRCMNVTMNRHKIIDFVVRMKIFVVWMKHFTPHLQTDQYEYWSTFLVVQWQSLMNMKEMYFNLIVPIVTNKKVMWQHLTDLSERYRRSVVTSPKQVFLWKYR